jgi:hypothetical protein
MIIYKYNALLVDAASVVSSRRIQSPVNVYSFEVFILKTGISFGIVPLSAMCKLCLTWQSYYIYLTCASYGFFYVCDIYHQWEAHLSLQLILTVCLVLPVIVAVPGVTLSKTGKHWRTEEWYVSEGVKWRYVVFHCLQSVRSRDGMVIACW